MVPIRVATFVSKNSSRLWHSILLLPWEAAESNLAFCWMGDRCLITHPSCFALENKEVWPPPTLWVGFPIEEKRRSKKEKGIMTFQCRSGTGSAHPANTFSGSLPPHIHTPTHISLTSICPFLIPTQVSVTMSLYLKFASVGSGPFPSSPIDIIFNTAGLGIINYFLTKTRIKLQLDQDSFDHFLEPDMLNKL